MTSRKEKAQQMKQQIQQTAYELTAERGYDNFSMADIATRIGCSAGNVYYHFKSKDALFASLAELEFQKYQDLVDRCLNDNDTPAEERILRFTSGALSTLFDEPFLSHGVSYSLTSNDGKYSKANSMTLFAETIEHLIRICITEGSLPETTDVVNVTYGVQTIFFGSMLQHLYAAPDVDIAKYAQGQVADYLRGVAMKG